MADFDELSLEGAQVCPNCGNPVGDDSECHNCGTVLYQEDELDLFNDDAQNE